MQIEASRVGLGDLAEGRRLHVPAGLLGFPERKEYQILNHTRAAPFRWLQAIENPPLVFAITDPFIFVPDYQVEITPTDLQELGGNDANQFLLCAIVTLPGTTSPDLTMNLQGPVLVNHHNGWAKQLVLINSLYHTHHPLLVSHHTHR